MILLRQSISGEQRSRLCLLIDRLKDADETKHDHSHISLGNRYNIIGFLFITFQVRYCNGSEAWLEFEKFRPGFEYDLDDTYQEKCEELIGFYWVYNCGGYLIGLHKLDERQRLTFKEWAELLQKIII